MSPARPVEVHLPARNGRLLLGVAGSTYLHLLILFLLLAAEPTLRSGPLRLPAGPSLAVTLVAGFPSAPRPAATAAPEPAREATPSPPVPVPVAKPAPERPRAVREIPKPDPTRTETPPRAVPVIPASERPIPSPEETPGPASVAAVGSAGAPAGGGGVAGGLEGVAGVETYNQRVATILSNFIPWGRLVAPPGSSDRRLTVAFIASREGDRARIERVVIAEASGYEQFDLAVTRAVREMAYLPLPAGREKDHLSFRYQVVLRSPREMEP